MGYRVRLRLRARATLTWSASAWRPQRNPNPDSDPRPRLETPTPTLTLSLGLTLTLILITGEPGIQLPCAVAAVAELYRSGARGGRGYCNERTKTTKTPACIDSTRTRRARGQARRTRWREDV